MPYLDRAFDLSYLQSSEFPQTSFKSFGVLGGGTAGYFAALALKKCHPNLDISLIESSKIPVIGVGESTTTEVLPFLHHLLDIDPLDFFKEVEPTLKFGIQFDWGEPGAKPFNFNFFASHHHESYFYEKHIENSNWASVLMSEGKIPILINEKNELLPLLSRIPFAYHIDNKKFVTYLKKKVAEASISMIDAEVTDILVKDDGLVESLKDSDGNTHSFDIFIDCTGFRSKILGENLNTPFHSFEDTLKNDKALTFNLDNKQIIDPFTSAITMNNGWCWKIPMRSEDHYGYVYSSKFCSEEEALKEAQNKFGPISEHKLISFRSGRHQMAWNKNVFALGNAFAFVEPLESTAIQTVIHSIMLLCRLMPKSLSDQSSINGLNQEINANWDSFRWFLGVHYKFNNKLDTPYWQACRNETNIGHASEILELFKAKAPLSKGHYGTTSGFAAHPPLIFNAYSYDTLLFGQNLVSKNLEAPQMNQKEYEDLCLSYKMLTAQSLTQQELYSQPQVLEQMVLPSIFEDPDSWLASTPV